VNNQFARSYMISIPGGKEMAPSNSMQFKRKSDYCITTVSGTDEVKVKLSL
jgi:hypothetical protein